MIIELQDYTKQRPEREGHRLRRWAQGETEGNLIDLNRYRDRVSLRSRNVERIKAEDISATALSQAILIDEIFSEIGKFFAETGDCLHRIDPDRVDSLLEIERRR